MSLIDPSLGEFLDRLSILRLKIEHGEAEDKDVSHFRDEQQGILSRLRTVNLMTLPFEKLADINQALWESTDALRIAIATHDEPLQARFGRIILRLNDQRAELVRQINEAHGDFRVEKLG